MKKHTLAVLSIFAAVATVGVKLASHSETSVGLRDVSLIQHSEHSHSGPTVTLAGIRIRLSPGDFSYQMQATAQAVPQISIAAE